MLIRLPRGSFGNSFGVDRYLHVCLIQLEHPADLPCLLHLSMCSALCNDSKLQYNSEKGAYDKIGESTEVALRVLVEKVTLHLFSVVVKRAAILAILNVK